MLKLRDKVPTRRGSKPDSTPHLQTVRRFYTLPGESLSILVTNSTAFGTDYEAVETRGYRMQRNCRSRKKAPAEAGACGWITPLPGFCGWITLMLWAAGTFSHRSSSCRLCLATSSGTFRRRSRSSCRPGLWTSWSKSCHPYLGSTFLRYSRHHPWRWTQSPYRNRPSFRLPGHDCSKRKSWRRRQEEVWCFESCSVRSGPEP